MHDACCAVSIILYHDVHTASSMSHDGVQGLIEILVYFKDPGHLPSLELWIGGIFSSNLRSGLSRFYFFPSIDDVVLWVPPLSQVCPLPSPNLLQGVTGSILRATWACGVIP